MNRTRRISVAAPYLRISLVLSLLVLCVWLKKYSGSDDRKTLNTDAERDAALVAMNYDVGSKERVKGMTKEQLKARFGYVRALNEVSPYYQACYITPGRFSEPSANEVKKAVESEGAFFLSESPWMVVMKDGRAADIVMCKDY
jgi:hypothetical protein